MNIVYTESALIELEIFKEQRKQELESYIKRNKYVFGDDVLEITASDIRDANKYFKKKWIIRPKLPLTRMVLKIYLIAGVATMIFGLFYSEIIQLLNQNPKQLAIILAGFIISLISFFGNYYFRLLENRRAEFENRYIERKLSTKSDEEN